MHPRLWHLLTLASSLLLCFPYALAQGGGATTDPFASIGNTLAGTRSYQSRGGVLILTVYDEKHALLDRQAVVKLENKATQSTMWATTADKSEAYFVDLATGQYDLEISAVGYSTVNKTYAVGSSSTTFRLEVTLPRDPNSVELKEPNAPDMPSKARKQTQRGVRALKAGNLKEAQKQLEEAYKTVPNSADVNFLLGYLYLQRKDYPQAQNFLAKAVTADHRNVQALTLLGRVRLQRGEFDAAKATLEEAVAADPDYWMAHSLLADAYLQRHEFEKSRQQAEMAIERSKGAGNSAQLVLGQALASLGKNDDAISALDIFLRNAPASSRAPRVRDLIAQLRVRAAAPAGSMTTSAPVASTEPLIDDTELRLSIKTWEPAGIDDVKPSVSAEKSMK